LNDQGTVTAATIPSRWQYSSWGDMNGINLLGPVAVGRPAIAMNAVFNCPLEELSMQLLSPRPIVLPAREGVYVPARYLGPSIPFSLPTLTNGVTGLSVFDNVYVFPGGTARPPIEGTALPMFPLVQTTSGALVNYYPSWVVPTALQMASGGAGGICAPLDSCFTSMTNGVAIFRGLSPAASVTVKVFLGTETAVRVDSPFRQFVSPANPYSPTALALYHDIASQLPDAYPSRFNSLGTLLNVVGRMAMRVLPIVGPKLLDLGKQLGGRVLERVIGGGDGGPAAPAVRVRSRSAPVQRPRTASVASSRKKAVPPTSKKSQKKKKQTARFSKGMAMLERAPPD